MQQTSPWFSGDVFFAFQLVVAVDQSEVIVVVAADRFKGSSFSVSFFDTDGTSFESEGPSLPVEIIGEGVDAAVVFGLAFAGEDEMACGVREQEVIAGGCRESFLEKLIN
jgi:hypothetical protein